MVFYDELINQVHPAWTDFLNTQIKQDYFINLMKRLEDSKALSPIYPPKALWLHALSFFPPQNTRVVILGQDPYHGEGQAHGLSFSVPMGQKFPPSLRNILKEWSEDTGNPMPFSGDLSSWAEEGVLLLNSSLSVEAQKARAHLNWGWQKFTDALIQYLADSQSHIVFILWGKPAQAKKKLIPEDRHCILEAPHPSPLSAHRGFFGSKPFSTANRYLKEQGLAPISWSLI